jgi:hypothetical protein
MLYPLYLLALKGGAFASFFSYRWFLLFSFYSPNGLQYDFPSALISWESLFSLKAAGIFWDIC